MHPLRLALNQFNIQTERFHVFTCYQFANDHAITTDTICFLCEMIDTEEDLGVYGLTGGVLGNPDDPNGDWLFFITGKYLDGLRFVVATHQLENITDPIVKQYFEDIRRGVSSANGQEFHTPTSTQATSLVGWIQSLGIQRFYPFLGRNPETLLINTP